MQNRKIALFATVLAATFTLAGCGKKKQSGPINGSPFPTPEDGSLAGKATPTPVPGLDEDDITSARSVTEVRNIYFDFDRYEIRSDQHATLEANARWFNANSDKSAIVEGHCDERGTNDYNLALGERRARAIVRADVAGQGLDEPRQVALRWQFELGVKLVHDRSPKGKR